MIDTIIFDLDGTLLNTLDDLAASVNFTMRRFACPERTVDEVRAFVGEGVSVLLLRALPEDKKHLRDECLTVFAEHYDKNKTNFTKPYAGVADMVLRAATDGYKTAIVSNKYDAAVRELRDAEFPIISVTVGERVGVAKKPAPDMVYIALKELGVKAENAVYVGDSDIDVTTARRSGLPVVGVTWGFRDRALLESVGADEIIDSPDQLMDAIERLKRA